MKLRIITLILMCMVSFGLSAQTTDISKMTKEEIMQMSYDQLLELPFEDLLKLADIVGVSADELLQMVLNQELSTASKKKESLFDSPLSTSVISKEEIANSGATSIPELFRAVPGVIVREKSNGNYEVHLRGLDNVPPNNVSHFSDNTLTLVMIDGSPVYNYANGGTFWETLPVNLIDIERIDIIRGPTSALYGPNAVSGVINIITKKQQTESGVHAQADAKYGMYNTLQAQATVGSNFGKGFSFRASGGYEKRDRTQEDYYVYAAGKYLPKEKAYSIFGFARETPYFNGLYKFENPLEAIKKYNVNGNLYYKKNDLSLHLMGAYQNSNAQTVFMESYSIPFMQRTSKMMNTKLAGSWKNLSFNISNMLGQQDISKDSYWLLVKFDVNTINANVEYTQNILDKLSITPGFNIQHAEYDIGNYENEARERFISDSSRVGSLFGGNNVLQTYGGSLRLDYQPIDPLRFIAALRLDKYNYPEKAYMSFQFVGSYKLNKNRLFRLLYSRANRGSFMANTYIDYTNKLMPAANVTEGPASKIYQNLINAGLLDPNELIYFQHYGGNKKLKLPVMDMIELGYRTKITKRLQADVEVFYSMTKNFDDLATLSNDIKIKGIKDPNKDTVYMMPYIYEELQYKNIDLKATQMGISYAINYMPINNLQLTLYGTLQKTDLKDHIINGKKTDLENKWTPRFYGGLTVNYAPIQKLNIYANLNYKSSQEFSRYVSPFGKPNEKGIIANPNEKGTDFIGGSAMLNLSVSYKVWKENSVYISARNLFSNYREFGFADPVKPMVLGGVRMNF